MAPRFWYRPFHSFFSYVLNPLAFLYRGIIAIRRWMYQVGIKKTNQFSVPIVVVGNITVGGSGKTPFVIWLVNRLKNCGFNPGVVSRGYGGKRGKSPVSVTVGSDPRVVGDEALLLVIKTNCPMVVSANRSAAVTQLLRDYHCDVVISDDGLQHYAMGRDIEVIILDPNCRLGNEYCLPAGPLREPKSRLKTVNFVVEKQLWPLEIYQLNNPEKKISLNALKGRTVHAIAGLGNPKSFFYQLELLGAYVIAHPFPDHYVYQAKDFNFNDKKLIIMSEKDAIKCRFINNARLFCLSVDLVVPDQFQQEFFKILNLLFADYSYLDKNDYHLLSSSYGSLRLRSHVA
ncbi:Tetraacyldisaccharide 4'-kinase [Coxiella endosymbiont of Amblyomma nuttalli]|nr:Tetraacyldisaccharide 4'-kinase [Coxiella endosymbiont of Amblyomma nuttalli]